VPRTPDPVKRFPQGSREQPSVDAAQILRVFHNDSSPKIRERAACSLAQSGMLSRAQRPAAVPKLLDYTDDLSLDPETRTWAFQALRDITGQTLPRDAAAWRRWYDSQR
jgi:hypothetical protein